MKAIVFNFKNTNSAGDYLSSVVNDEELMIVQARWSATELLAVMGICLFNILINDKKVFTHNVEFSNFFDAPLYNQFLKLYPIKVVQGDKISVALNIKTAIVPVETAFQVILIGI